MIKVLQKADIERVVDIWLDTNLKAHYFIPGQYWKDNIDLVKEMLPQAEVYVYENDCLIEGFIGLMMNISKVFLSVMKCSRRV